MQTLLLQGDSKEDLKSLSELAKKLGIKVKFLSEDDAEDMGLLAAIRKGRSKKYVDPDQFLKGLRS
ncbi:MAG: hypothetical protein WAT37_20870 [Saprospiraceae bacterium]|jgi:hypothetical protein